MIIVIVTYCSHGEVGFLYVSQVLAEHAAVPHSRSDLHASFHRLLRRLGTNVAQRSCSHAVLLFLTDRVRPLRALSSA